MMMEWLDIIFSLLTLTVLEIVLGVDNLVFLSIISSKLPKQQQQRARRWGLTLAWVTRLIFLCFALWLTRLIAPLFYIFSVPISVRSIFLCLGGLFLLVKATQEIHAVLESAATSQKTPKKSANFLWVITQIALLDIIFSIDSVLTAIGLTQRFWLMAVAITVAIGVMLLCSEVLSRLIERHPTLKILALSFLILIGIVLIADSLSFHIPRGYIYFGMAFSLGVEALNMIRQRKERKAKSDQHD